MKVKLKTRMAGPAGNFPADSIQDFPEAVAKELIEANFAQPAPKRPPTEPKPPDDDSEVPEGSDNQPPDKSKEADPEPKPKAKGAKPKE